MKLPNAQEATVQDRIATRWQSRATTYGSIVETIAALISTRVGNYLVFFPSYAYLTEVQSRFAQAYPTVHIESQTLGMTESQREQFLEKFQANPSHTLVAFAVLGGIFGEGIDLIGRSLDRSDHRRRRPSPNLPRTRSHQGTSAKTGRLRVRSRLGLPRHQSCPSSPRPRHPL